MLASAARSRSASRRRIGGSRTATARCAASTTAACSRRASALRARRSAGSKATDEIVHYRATAAFERPFCRRCGSTVPAVSHDERYWHVPAGLLEGDLGARPRTHIFVASRSPLAELDDVLPRHAAYPPGIALPIVETPRVHDASAAVSGSCLCGSVAFAAAAIPRRVVNCYCSLCRRSRAAAFSSTLLVPRDAFRWIARRGASSPPDDAAPRCRRPHAGALRRCRRPRVANAGAICGRRYATDFCADCGSLAPSAPEGSATAMLPAGAIDTPLPPLTGRASLRRLEGAVVRDRRRLAAVRRAAAAGAVHRALSVARDSCSKRSKRCKSSLLSMHSYSRIRSPGRSRKVSRSVHGRVKTAGSSIVTS